MLPLTNRDEGKTNSQSSVFPDCRHRLLTSSGLASNTFVTTLGQAWGPRKRYLWVDVQAHQQVWLTRNFAANTAIKQAPDGPRMRYRAKVGRAEPVVGDVHAGEQSCTTFDCSGDVTGARFASTVHGSHGHAEGAAHEVEPGRRRHLEHLAKNNFWCELRFKSSRSTGTHDFSTFRCMCFPVGCCSTNRTRLNSHKLWKRHKKKRKKFALVFKVADDVAGASSTIRVVDETMQTHTSSIMFPVFSSARGGDLSPPTRRARSRPRSAPGRCSRRW